MRRKDKEIQDKNLIFEILKKAHICRLGLSDNNIPYVVPLNFVHFKNTLYIHCAKEGKKIEILKKNKNVCFEIDINTKLILKDPVCASTMQYQSVIGFGKASFVTEKQEKEKALNLIVEKYAKKKMPLNEKMVESTAVIKIEVKKVTGKQSGF
jgi:nitroimidazol reductase NimA-like FMN-containing flavoprotein (pyridoxamine 5'-phosphate oxidase superfamily)